ncbi:MAG: hypothetical protein ACTSYI_17660 [Promethearchaeota archaeon]
MAEIPKFEEFNFNELKDMVKAIARTKHKSREGRWKNGYGLQSFEHLEAHIDGILKEMARRIREEFSIGRIQYNFRHNKANLPPEIYNLNNINDTQLNGMLYKNAELVGSELNAEGEEEIFICFNDTKYRMKKDGSIQVK